MDATVRASLGDEGRLWVDLLVSLILFPHCLNIGLRQAYGCSTGSREANCNGNCFWIESSTRLACEQLNGILRLKPAIMLKQCMFYPRIVAGLESDGRAALRARPDVRPAHEHVQRRHLKSGGRLLRATLSASTRQTIYLRPTLKLLLTVSDGYRCNDCWRQTYCAMCPWRCNNAIHL